MNGSDHELGIFDAKGRSIPAHRRGFPHKDAKPPLQGTYGKLIRDGWNVEFNPLPGDCRETFAYYVLSLVASGARMLCKGEVFRPVPAYEIDIDDLENAPEDVTIAGCDKSWNAYTEKESAPEVDLRATNIRCAGGHMHFSTSGVPNSPYNRSSLWLQDPKKVFRYVKMLDRFPGLISTYIFGSDLAGIRRRFYGKAGEFRYQKYKGAFGLEYRTPGPEIFSTVPMMSLHYGLMRFIYQHFEQFSARYNDKYEIQVQEIINRGESDPSLLDLIPALPYYYTKPLLQLARQEYRKTMHAPIQPFLTIHGNHGWDNWASRSGAGLPAGSAWEAVSQARHTVSPRTGGMPDHLFGTYE